MKRTLNGTGLEMFKLWNQWFSLFGVEPEKAGVGGSIPSLATIFNHFQHRIATECVQKRGHSTRFHNVAVPRKCLESKQLQDRRAQPSRVLRPSTIHFLPLLFL